MTYNASTTVPDVNLSNLQRFVREYSKYYSIILVVVGSVSNILAIVTLSRRAFKKSTMSVYLRFVALMDICTLYAALRYFLLALLDYDMRRDNWACWFIVWIGLSTVQLSAWSLVAITTERVLSIVYPVKIQILCSLKRSRIVIAALVVLSLAVNAQVFVVFGHKVLQDGVIYCQPVDNHLGLIQTICDFTFTVAMLVVLNIIIVVGLARNREKLFPKLAQNQSTVTARGRSTDSIDVEAQPSAVSKTRTQLKATAVGSRERRERSLTVTLVFINIVFISCNFPLGIYNIIYPFLELSVSDVLAIQIILLMLFFTNNAVNFFLYLATGSIFRAEFVAMILKFCPAESPVQIKC